MGAMPRPDAQPPAEGGFSLIEAIVAIFILTIVALAMGSLVGVGMLNNQSADDLTQATALASAKLEELRSGEYWSLTAGGSLDESQDGYSDSPDLDGDGTSEFDRRWRVTDQAGGKTLEVRAIAVNAHVGPGKAATMATVVAAR